MKPMFRRLAGLTAMSVIALAAAAGAGPPGKAIAWQTDFKKAQTIAGKQKKIMMIDFYSEG